MIYVILFLCLFLFKFFYLIQSLLPDHVTVLITERLLAVRIMSSSSDSLSVEFKSVNEEDGSPGPIQNPDGDCSCHGPIIPG